MDDQCNPQRGQQPVRGCRCATAMAGQSDARQYRRGHCGPQHSPDAIGPGGRKDDQERHGGKQAPGRGIHPGARGKHRPAGTDDAGQHGHDRQCALKPLLARPALPPRLLPHATPPGTRVCVPTGKLIARNAPPSSRGCSIDIRSVPRALRFAGEREAYWQSN